MSHWSGAGVTDSSQHFTLSIIKCILSAGENILKGNSPCLGTSWWVSYTQVSPYISDQSPSKSSYFTLISASSSRIDSENIFDLFRLLCFPRDLGLIRLISNIPFHQKFICNSLSLRWSQFDILELFRHVCILCGTIRTIHKMLWTT